MSLNGDYSIFERSMNGVKTLSDGISTISDGIATHEKIFYTDQIQSSPDGQTTIDQTFITTEMVNCDTLNATNTNVDNLDASLIDALRLRINNSTGSLIYDFNGNTSTATFNGVSNFNNTINITNKNIVQTQTGEINQSGTGTNDLKDTNINGFLVVGSNITQNGGSASFKDITCDNLTMRSGKSITQSGNNVSNTLAGTTTTKDLIILDSVVFPPNVTVPGTTTTDDIIMADDSIIIQDLTVEPSGKTNIFRNTKTLELDVDGNLDMIKGGSTATLKNTIIQGTAEIQGDITQTTGATVLKTISCNNITLNADQIITQSGSGYITQSGTGQNILKEINLTNNSNIIFNGNGVISQPLNTSVNVMNNSRFAGYSIFGGRNNTTYTNTQNIQNNNGLQLQFNRDNSTQYSFLMNNRGTGGNGGFRFQRYVAGVYVDEPITIDDTVTINKNVSIPGGSLSCSSATLGAISQNEINCLDNCAVNIQTQFNTIDSQIASLQTSGNNNSVALTGISYVSATDTTLIDNNLTISTGKNLVVGSTNIITAINAINSTLSGVSYDAGQDLTTINNHVLLPTGNNLLLGTMNVGSSITNLNTVTSGMTYASGTDTTTIDNNVTINKTLIVQGMNIKAEIDALDTSFTTGTISSTSITTANLTVTNLANVKQLDVSQSITAGNDIVGGADLYITNDITGYGSLFLNNSGGSLNVGGNIIHKTNIAINSVFSLLTSVTLTYPLNEYYVSSLSSTVTVTLPAVPISRNDIVINFVLLNMAGKIIVASPTGTPFTDINGNSITTFTLQNNSFVSVRIMSQNSGWNIIEFMSPKAISGQSLSISQNATIGGTLDVTNNMSVGGIAEATGIVATNSYFRLNNRVNLGVAVNQNTNTTLSFPLNEYYLINQPNTTIDITLPEITNANQNDAVTNFILNIKTATCNIYKPASTNFFDINKNAISEFQLKGDANISVKIIAVDNAWCIIDMWTNNVTINEATITQATIDYTNGWFKSPANVPGYRVNGSNAFDMMPIPCSLKGILPDNSDDYWIVNPGFRFDIYRDLNYGGSVQSFTNDGIAPEVFTPSTANTTSSIKVYYRNRSADQWGLITRTNLS